MRRPLVSLEMSDKRSVLKTKPKRRPTLTLLPKGFTIDPAIKSARENVGLEEKYAEALASIEKYGLPGKKGEKELDTPESGSENSGR